MRFVAFLLTFLAVALPAQAEDVPQAAPGDEMCSVPADASWKPQEQFVWNRVCLGQEANFNMEPGYGGDLDPKDPAGLPDSRILSSKFLATILLSDKYRRALTSRGVRIIGARFAERLDLQNAELTNELWLERSLFENGADLRGLRSTRGITLYGSKIAGALEMSDLELHGDLSLRMAKFAAVDLSFTRVDGILTLGGSTVGEDLNMVGLQVGGSLLMDDKAKFARIDLTSARVGWLSLATSQATGLLNLAEVHVDHDLLMYQAELAEVLLGSAHVQGHLILANAKVIGDLTMVGLQVDGNLVALKAELNNANFAYADVHGVVSLIGATVTGDLDMTGLRVARDLQLMSISERQMVASLPQSLRVSLDALGVNADKDATAVAKARFGKVVLASAEVQGGLSLIGATLSGSLLMDGARIGGDLTMTEGEYEAVSLERARVAGVFNARGSTFGGPLDCYGSEIRSRMTLGGGAEFARPIICSFARIGELDLAGGSFKDEVDLTGTQITSELRIGLREARTLCTAANSTLHLRNASAEAIQDSQDGWPCHIDLTGFVYHNLGGRNVAQENSMADRPASWFSAWLRKQEPYAPGPYEQLATVLRNGGSPSVADEVLYAGKQRERAQASFSYWAWLTTIRALIGYGYHLEWALVWVAGFVVTGIAVLRFSGQGPKNRMPFGIAYSFDMLLPIIRLRERHYQIDLQGWSRYYFYAHKVMGYVLASFLIAGLAGMTK